MIDEQKSIKQIAKEARKWISSEEGQVAIAEALAKARKELAELHRPNRRRYPTDWW